MRYTDMEIDFFTPEQQQRFHATYERDVPTPSLTSPDSTKPLASSHRPGCRWGGCWEWRGGQRDSHGFRYGVFSANGQSYYAHRVAWLLEHGEIDDELTIDHLCGNKLCVNPGHMELVTQSVNTRRQYSKPGRLYALTCRRGHGKVFGQARCSRCNVEAVAASMAKKPEKYREMRARNKREERARKRAS